MKPTPGSEAAFTQSVKSTAVKAAALAAGIFAVRKLFQIGKESLDSFYEAERVTAQLDSRVRALGEAAGVTTEGVEEIADRLLNLAGIEDETTKSAATLLLTFTNLRNSVGQGNDVFDRALTDLTDMSIVMGTDARGAALQLGKALNDPTTGLTALRRAGVSFTESQKVLIAQLVESGDLLGAQKIILSELEKEFGGAAAALGETAAGRAAILSANVGELKEAFGQLLSEGLNPVIDALTKLAQADLGAIEVQQEMTSNAQATRDQIDALARSYLDHNISLDELNKRVHQSIDFLDEQTLALGAESDLRLRGTQLLYAAEKGEKALSDMIGKETDETKKNIAAKIDQRQVNEDAAQSVRDLLDAELQASGGLLGAISATREARDARQELGKASARLAKLEAEGKRGTDRWKEARKEFNDLTFESLEAQQKLEESFVSYGQSLLDANLNQADAIAKVKELAKQGGVAKDSIQGIIDRVRDYSHELGVVPEHVKSKIELTGITDSIAAIDSLIDKQNELDANRRNRNRNRGGPPGAGASGPPQVGPDRGGNVTIIDGRVVEESNGRHRRKVGGRSVP